jgi:hypothetical protein
MENKSRKPSRLWYLFPILFGIIGNIIPLIGGFFPIIGGIIGYQILKDRDKKIARGVLIIGIVYFFILLCISFLYLWGFFSIFSVK